MKCLVFPFLLIPGLLFSQTVTHHNAATEELLAKYEHYCRKIETAEGYRIQIAFTEDRGDAYAKKARLYRELPDLKSYVEYEQPYFKLRIGDFRSRLLATYWLNEVIKIYPEAFIVNDHIKVK